MPAERLPDPVVAPDVYTEAYYRAACMGATAWERSGGTELDPLYAGYALKAQIATGEVLVDLGCGRGEMLVAALQAGAARAIGVEYAEAGVALAAQTLQTHGVADRAELHHGDARSIPVADATADVVTLLDVVEHLVPEELDRALGEARRVLRPGGRLLVHTMPNRTIYEVTYRLQRLARPGRRRRWPADPRNALEQQMHVNEQTVTSLRRAVRRAGFTDVAVDLGAWMWTDFVPDERARVTYHRLAARRLTERLGKGDLWARARLGR
jgi:ubiquinone/menaquinone biosynthesis C-methylase UbiE